MYICTCTIILLETVHCYHACCGVCVFMGYTRENPEGRAQVIYVHGTVECIYTNKCFVAVGRALGTTLALNCHVLTTRGTVMVCAHVSAFDLYGCLHTYTYMHVLHTCINSIIL